MVQTITTVEILNVISDYAVHIVLFLSCVNIIMTLLPSSVLGGVFFFCLILLSWKEKKQGIDLLIYEYSCKKIKK